MSDSLQNELNRALAECARLRKAGVMKIKHTTRGILDEEITKLFKTALAQGDG